MDIQEFVPLSSLTTFRVGGPARYLATIHDTKKLPEVAAFARSHKLPMFFLGAGSNLLVSDEPLDAVVVKIIQKGIEYVENSYIENSGDCVVVAFAGEKWDDLVQDAVERGFGGIENLSLIPGLVGAAPVQNIGAYGVELANVLEWVEAFDIENLKFVKLERKDCQFDYRMSIFKTSAGKKFIVTKVALRLRKFSSHFFPHIAHEAAASSYSPNISYKDLAQYFSTAEIDRPTIQDVRKAVIVIRNRKLPDPSVVPNAGSFFKNPVISETQAAEIREKFPLLPAHPVLPARPVLGTLSGGSSTGLVKISAAWIIDHVADLAGKGNEKVSTYENQALVIVNRGGATARDIKNFAETIALIVKEKTKIKLETEVEWIDGDVIKNFARLK